MGRQNPTVSTTRAQVLGLERPCPIDRSDTYPWRMQSRLLLCMMAAAVYVSSCSPQPSPRVLPKLDVKPPAPNLASFVPANYRVTSTRQVAMDPKHPVPQVIVTAVGLPGQIGVPANVIILAWDAAAHRWTSVFDGSKQELPNFSQPPDLLLPQDQDISSLRAVPIHAAPGAGLDVVVSASRSAGSHTTLAVGVVHFEKNVAQLIWSFSDRGGEATVTGPARKIQRLAITATYQTAVDAGCCPIRDYHLTVGKVAGSYKVLSDDRPFLGITVMLASLDRAAKAVVVRVAPGSPADGVLRVGDILTAVDGDPPVDPEGLLGPGVIDQVALHHPGDKLALDVERQGSRRVLTVTAASMITVSDSLPRPQCGFLGVTVQTSTEPPGVVVVDVGNPSPARDGGISLGDLIQVLGDAPVRDADDLIELVCRHEPGDQLLVRYKSGDGSPGTATVTLGTPPATSAALLVRV